MDAGLDVVTAVFSLSCLGGVSLYLLVTGTVQWAQRRSERKFMQGDWRERWR